MTTELDTSLPSTRQIQTLISEKPTVEVKLLTGDLITGQVRWQDPNCIAIAAQDGGTLQIWFHAIAYVKRL
ncbi:MAG TPA: RNA-binding protein hfq [Leptolyngbyaceae cyanobacterium]